MRIASSIAALLTLLCASPALADYTDDQAKLCADGAGQPAIDACTWAIQSGQWTGDHLAWAYDDRGYLYHRAGRDADAVNDYNQAILLKSSDFQYYLNRGYAHKMLGHHQLATDDYNRAIQLNPGFKMSYLVRGENYASTGDFADAIVDYTRAIELDPAYAKAYNDRGYAKEQMGDKSGGAADRARARELDPNVN